MFSRNPLRRRFVFGLLLVISIALLGASLPTIITNYSRGDSNSNVEWHPVVLAEPIVGAGVAATSADEDFSNCRYGAAYIGTSPGSENWLPSLNAGWFLTFHMDSPEVPSAEFVPVVRVRQRFGIGGRSPLYYFIPTLDVVKDYLVDNPGSLILLGNEIEIDNDIQDNIMPDAYARAYHEAYHLVKSTDPTATVGIGSVTMVTPGRMQYLDMVLKTYRNLYETDIPVDVWNIHLYILPERNLGGTSYADGKIALGTDPNIAIRSSGGNAQHCPLPSLPDLAENDPRLDIYCLAEHDSSRIFKDQIFAMRQWMKENGEQDKPLIISEYGVLPGYRNPLPDGSCVSRKDEFGRCMFPERVTNYLQDTIEFLDSATDPSLGYPQDDYRLVQRWLWYSLETSHLVGSASNLLVPNYASFEPGSDDALTLMGKTFKEMARNPDNKTNLVAVSARSSDIFLENVGDTGTATIAATFRNDSTINIGLPFAVSFYSNRHLTEFIGTVLINPVEDGLVRGCSWQLPDHVVQMEWSGLAPGVHSYWAKIDSSLSVPEDSETDNVTAMGRVIVYSQDVFTYNSYVPMIRD